MARVPVAPGGSDLCFSWAGSAEEAVAHLDRLGIPIERGPVPRNGARGAGRSVLRRPEQAAAVAIALATGEGATAPPWQPSSVRRPHARPDAPAHEYGILPDPESHLAAA